jgi:hypothetical protein
MWDAWHSTDDFDNGREPCGCNTGFSSAVESLRFPTINNIHSLTRENFLETYHAYQKTDY